MGFVVNVGVTTKIKKRLKFDFRRFKNIKFLGYLLNLSFMNLVQVTTVDIVVEKPSNINMISNSLNIFKYSVLEINDVVPNKNNIIIKKKIVHRIIYFFMIKPTYDIYNLKIIKRY